MAPLIPGLRGGQTGGPRQNDTDNGADFLRHRCHGARKLPAPHILLSSFGEAGPTPALTA
jgi:hypothetical protein